MLNSLLNKDADVQCYYKETPTQLFSFKICEIFKNIYFEEHMQTTASVAKVKVNVNFERINYLLIKSVLVDHAKMYF